MRLGHFEARRICSRRCSLEFISKEGKGALGIGSARPTLFAAERRCLMCRTHSASRSGASHTSTVQPKAGRSENIYWLCKVSLLLPPSSLGLDGHGQYLSCFEDMQEVPEEPSLLAHQLASLVHGIKVTISRKDIGGPSLNWLLPSQESSTSCMKKCSRLWLTNLMCLWSWLLRLFCLTGWLPSKCF